MPSGKDNKMKKSPVKVYFDVPDAGCGTGQPGEASAEPRMGKMDTKWPGSGVQVDINKLKKDLLHYVSHGLLLGDARRATVALVKPDAVRDGLLSHIRRQIEDSGLHIIAEAHKNLTKMEAITLYSKHADKEYFDELTDFMSSGPAHVLVLVDDTASANAPHEDTNVITKLRDVVGPTDVEEARLVSPHSIRAMFATSTVQNAIHACADVDEAKRELMFFFPELEKSIQESMCDRMIVVVLPDYLSLLDDLLETLKERSYEVVREKQVFMTKVQATALYGHLEQEPRYNDMINYLVGGKSGVFLIKRDDIIESWKELMGPEDVEVAKATAPQSLSSRWSDKLAPSVLPPLYGSRSAQDSVRDQGLFYPLQRTLAIIKPDAAAKKEEILQRVSAAGFQVVNELECVMTGEKVHELYREHSGNDWFPDFVRYMTSGTSLCLILQKEDAVREWRELIGPTDPAVAKDTHPQSLRAIYGTDIMRNALHGSSNVEQADHRVLMAFPHSALPTVVESEEGEESEPMDTAQPQPESQAAGGKPDEAKPSE